MPTTYDYERECDEIDKYKEKREDEIKFLLKVKERLKGYACGKHKELNKMIENRIKELKHE